MPQSPPRPVAPPGPACRARRAVPEHAARRTTAESPSSGAIRSRAEHEAHSPGSRCARVG